MTELLLQLADILLTFFVCFAIVLFPMWKNRGVKARTVLIIYSGLTLYLCVSFLIVSHFWIVDFMVMNIFKLCAGLPVALTPFFVFRKRVWQNVFLISVMYMYGPIHIGTGTYADLSWFLSNTHPLLTSGIVSLAIVAVTLPPLLILLRQLCDIMGTEQTKVWRVIWLLPASFFALFVLTHNPFYAESFRGSELPLFRVLSYFAMLLTCYLLKTSLGHAAEAETAKRQAREQAAMREMINSISHDLKTPLTILGNNLEMLTEGVELGPEAEGYVSVAARKNDDLRRLISNLFAVSRIDARSDMLDMEPVPLPELFFELDARYAGSAANKGVAFSAPPPPDLCIRADRVRLLSVFDNLVYNALRHTESGGSITVSAEAVSGAVNIAVTDTGCGIATEHLPRIFEKFYKVSAARQENDGASGLGLYIVKAAMEDMGGAVSVNSDVGEGTAFALTFRS